MTKIRFYFLAALAGVSSVLLPSCDDDDAVSIHDINSAEKVSVDRFSPTAGHLMVRDASNQLPAANVSIDFDQPPFITKGLGPTGQVVEYYNFDIQPLDPAPIYVLFRQGESSPVSGQLNIIDVIPGESGYNDFWLVHKVTVPSNYQANQVASLDEIVDAGYQMEVTATIVNCPVIPVGSTATKRLGSGSAEVNIGWYKEKIVSYFTFDEKALAAISGKVPTSPIFVCFNVNVDESGGGPGSGFKVEPGTSQTHNVIATIPSSASYSPLWLVNAYDNAEFDSVDNLSTAQSAAGTNLGATVNCPVVSVE